MGRRALIDEACSNFESRALLDGVNTQISGVMASPGLGEVGLYIKQSPQAGTMVDF